MVSSRILLGILTPRVKVPLRSPRIGLDHKVNSTKGTLNGHATHSLPDGDFRCKNTQLVGIYVTLIDSIHSIQSNHTLQMWRHFFIKKINYIVVGNFGHNWHFKANCLKSLLCKSNNSVFFPPGQVRKHWLLTVWNRILRVKLKAKPSKETGRRKGE